MISGKKIFFFCLTVGFLSIFISLLISKNRILPHTNPNLRKIYIGKNLVWVKLAQSPQEREQGLSGVKTMAQNEGMLFVFSEKQRPVFWMKEMNFPLDFIWIADNKVVDLHQNIPAPSPGGPDQEIARVSPKQMVNMILEVNAGWVEKNQVKIGDSFLFRE